MSESVGVVILTPLNLEFKAVCAHLVDARTVWHRGRLAATIGTVPGVPWPVGVVTTGEGNIEAGVLAYAVSDWLRPRALLVVGVAGGLRDDLGLGDVVVATWVYGYQGGKETRDGSTARPRTWRADLGLEQAARMVEAAGTWTGSLTAQPSVQFKPIAAGDVVLNSRTSSLARQLNQNYSDAVAIEMESAGVASAAHLSQSLPVLVIRGISDMADGKKHLSDAAGLQPVAAAHAAAFAMAVLRELPWPAAGSFPGTGSGEAGPDTVLRWQPAERPLPAVWPGDLGLPRPRGISTVEVCLVPASPQRPIEARRLAALPAELASLGRAAGVFAPDADIARTDQPAAIAAAGRGAGLAVTRDGTRCGWDTLPQDTMGSVLDPHDLAARLASLLGALTRADVPVPDAAGLAVAVTPAVLLAEGRVTDLPRSVRGRTSLTPLQVPPAEVLPWPQMTGNLADAAAELAARLLLAFRARHAR